MLTLPICEHEYPPASISSVSFINASVLFDYGVWCFYAVTFGLLLGNFAFIKDIKLFPFSYNVLVWLWYQSHAGLVKWVPEIIIPSSSKSTKHSSQIRLISLQPFPPCLSLNLKSNLQLVTCFLTNGRNLMLSERTSNLGFNKKVSSLIRHCPLGWFIFDSVRKKLLGLVCLRSQSYLSFFLFSV